MSAAPRRIGKEDVLQIVGELDDLVVAQIVATGASVAELEEAVAELRSEVEAGEETVESTQPHVHELRAILDELFVEELSGADED